MSIRVSNLRLSVDEPEQALPRRLAAALDLRPDDITAWRILRKSLDARDKRDLAFVYSAEVTVPQDEVSLVARLRDRKRAPQAELYTEAPFTPSQPGSAPLEHRPVVVGSGPAGLMAAYFLARWGYRPLVLERGKPVRDRIEDVRALEAGGPLNPESNYLFGEGGAGTFSDGKLTCRLSGPEVRRVLEVLAECKGKPSILYDHRPHLGSNRLPAVVKALRRDILAHGGDFKFECRLEDLSLRDHQIVGVATSSGQIAANLVILAIGHSARDTYEMLHARGVRMEQKPFQLGVRIEQPQESVNRAQYGATLWEQKIGAADYTLVAHGSDDLFSFCMCAGGQIIPSVSEPGYFCTNGMSLSRRATPFANSGLMVTLRPEQFGSAHVLAGMMVQREHESRAFAVGRCEYLCPGQVAHDFLSGKKSTLLPPTSYLRGTISTELRALMPREVARSLETGLPLMDRRWHGRFLRDAVLVGPESRGSSPVRLPRDRVTLESASTRGLLPIGEGAGYAGGIISAAVDGLRAALAIRAAYAPLEPAQGLTP